MSHLFAYLDLASGSMIIQGAIAGIVAVPILFRNQIRRLLGRSTPTEDTIEDVTDPIADASEVMPTDGTGTPRP
ncbi:MAG: hypothetical protein KF809_11530 [Chloroflexi bacterium]|nr:hypothetical protein [Chloroflexota bacterium]